MAIVAAELIARVAVQGAKEAAAELGGVGSAAEKAGAILGIALAAGAVAVGAALYFSVKAAAEFQQNLLKLYTTAGESKSALDAVGKGILSMSTEVGIGANELLKGMYWVESAGFHGAAGLNVLRIAAEGAKTENSDLAGVAHALTGVLNTYASTNITAAQAMNVLIASVGQGATTLNDMSAAISNVLPAGSKFHLQLIDLTTAIATMTNQNDNAASAATHLRQVILALESPAKAGAKALAEIGLSSDALHKAMSQSLPGAIQLIIDLLGKRFPEGSAAYNDALKAIAGGNKQLMGMLELSGTSLDKWKNAVKAVTDQVKAGGNAVMGWADVQQNFNFKLDQAKAAVEKVAIEIGTGLLPFLGTLLGDITPLVSKFGDWATSANGLAGFLSQIGAAFAQVFGPAKSANTALSPLVDTFDRAKGIIKPLNDVLHPLADALFKAQVNAKPLLDTFDRATGVFKQATVALNPFVPILVWIRDAFLWVRDACIAVYNFMVPIVKIVLDYLTPLFKALGLMIQTILIPAWLGFVNAIKPYLPALLDLAKVLGVVLVAAFIIVIGVILGVIIAIGLLVAAFLWIATTITKVAQWVQTAIANIIGFFKWLYQQLVGGSIIPELVNGILSWFGKLQTAGQAIIQGFVNWITTTWKNLVASATSWGSSLINNFLSGLQSAWNAVVSWVTGALNWLKSHFPASPVQQGPLKGSELWGYNFGMNIANGLTASTGAVQSALGRMLGFMGSGSGFNLGISGSVGMRGPMPPSLAGGGGGPIIVYVMPPNMYIDSRQVAQAVGPQLAREVQIQTGWRKPS